MSEKTDIKSMDLEELKPFFSDMGEKAFRAKQVYEWLHVRQVESFEEMTNLSKTLRESVTRCVISCLVSPHAICNNVQIREIPNGFIRREKIILIHFTKNACIRYGIRLHPLYPFSITCNIHTLPSSVYLST